MQAEATLTNTSSNNHKIARFSRLQKKIAVFYSSGLDGTVIVISGSQDTNVEQ